MLNHIEHKCGVCGAASPCRSVKAKSRKRNHARRQNYFAL